MIQRSATTKPATLVAPVVLITGGDSGIGLAIARKFAEQSYRVAICGLGRKKGARAVASLRALKGEVIYIVADVRKEDHIRKVIRRTASRFGRLDVLCNNAGVQKLGAIEEAPSSLWDEVMAVNARAVFLGIKHALPHLKLSKGKIINISSTGGLVNIYISEFPQAAYATWSAEGELDSSGQESKETPRGL